MKSIRQWFDNGEADLSVAELGNADTGVDWLRVIPFLIMHMACLAVIFVGISSIAVAVAVALYLIRMFAITAFYHRYFSHKSFKTSRTVQFVFAFIGATATQRGPLWWAAHHRQHHRHADQSADPHSPKQGFFGAIWAGFFQENIIKLITAWFRTGKGLLNCVGWIDSI